MSYQYRKTVKLNNGRAVDAYAVRSDADGNPRRVIHFLAIASTYGEAITKAKQFGGKKYTARWFGGGIVFPADDADIKEILEQLIY